LGTETAYAVADEARAHAEKGNKVYPFHIGDLNFHTCSAIKEAMIQALAENKTGYCPAAGILPLRKALADYMGKKRGVSYGPENVSIQSGGKPVITKYLQVLCQKGDEILYPSPGYPIYESQINYLKGVGKPYRFIESEDGFVLDIPYLKSLISSKTKILIYNNYQNPCGSVSSTEEMEQVSKLCVEHDLLVLSDEAYFTIVYEENPRSIVSFKGMKDRTVILHTFSKSYSMTGWRLGAAVGPQWIVDFISKINTNDEACTTQFIQWAGLAAFTPEAEKFSDDLNIQLKKRRDVLVKGLNEVPGFKCVAPKSTFYLLANITKAMKQLNITNYEEFRRLLLTKTGVSVCTREHFGKALSGENEFYIRFAYSGIGVEEIEEACNVLKDYFVKVFENKDSRL